MPFLIEVVKRRKRSQKQIEFQSFTASELDVILRTKIERGRMGKFVTQDLWEALKKEEESLLMEFLEADKDSGNMELRKIFPLLKVKILQG